MSGSSQQADSTTARFLRDAGKVREEDNPIFRFPPAKWIVSMVQYLIAIIIVSKCWHSPREIIKNQLKS